MWDIIFGLYCIAAGVGLTALVHWWSYRSQGFVRWMKGDDRAAF